MLHNTLRNLSAGMALLLALIAPAPNAQEGCYFGVCPGDPGTEFPTTPTVQLPPSVPLPAPVPTSSSPPPGKTKGAPLPAPTEQSVAEQLCLGAHFIGADFVWTPPMTISNALALCEAALRANPSNLDLQFAYAVTRDTWSTWSQGSPADDFYAVTAYRELAAKGYPLAEYALGTMYDEDGGVEEAEGLSILRRGTEGAYGDGQACLSARTLYTSGNLTKAGAVLDLENLEQRARRSYTCASDIVFLAAYAAPGTSSLRLPLEAYARIAATHGSETSMYSLGSIYARGIDGAVTKNVERGGLWMLISYWVYAERYKPSSVERHWAPIFSARENAIAMQTALRSLGFYAGALDGAIGPASRAALSNFVASGMVDNLFQRLRNEEPLSPLLPPMLPLHLGDAALAQPL